MILSNNQIQYGFNYHHTKEQQLRCINEVSQYKNETKLAILCTQLGGADTPQYQTAKAKKQVLQEWCEFLSNNPFTFEELVFHSRVPQVLFDAICKQKNLKKLVIKWGSYPNISNLKNLQSLEYLHLGSGSSVKNIKSITQLPKLIALSIENFQNITNYSELVSLSTLESLEISGDTLNAKPIRIESLQFLTQMPQLRYFKMLDARIENKDLTPILSLKKLEHLTLSSNKETKKMYDQLIQLPKLKYGFLIEKAELYK